MANVIALVRDSLTNLVSRMGTGRDKAASSFYAFTPLSDAELLAAYRTAWLPRKIVDIPAFEEATVKLRDGEAVVASAYGIHLRGALLASAGRAPLAPPRAWFEVPEADGPTPLTITDDGQVYGHLATWDQCHGGYQGTCELAPRSKSGYKYFHLGSIVTAEGESLPVGRITVDKGGPIGGHLWDMYAGAQKAIEHYDRTGAVAAFVRATDGRYGIWVSGATKSDASAEAIRDMRACPPSGDWRYENGGMELIAALSVPVPGFPVPYMVASSGDQPVALIAQGYVEEEKKVVTRSEMRKMISLVSKAREALQMDQMLQDIPEEMICPTCDASMSPDASTCPMCGMDMTDMMAMKKKSRAACADESWMTADAVAELAAGALSEEQIKDAVEATIELAYNAEQRRRMAKSGEALPDGSFPIANCSDAEAAIHAQGRANDQGKAVAHIKKRVSSLGCSGTIFDNYK